MGERQVCMDKRNTPVLVNGASWFYRGTLAIPEGHPIVIRGARYSYLERCFEAREVLDTVSRITYRSDADSQPCETFWFNWCISGCIQQVIVTSSKTKFIVNEIDEIEREEK